MLRKEGSATTYQTNFMDTNKAKPNDGTDNQDIGIRELGRRIHRVSVNRGDWDFIDPKYPDLGPMVSPMMVDNRLKLMFCIQMLNEASMEDNPQDEFKKIRQCIVWLLDFCCAHNISLEFPAYDNPPTSPS